MLQAGTGESGGSRANNNDVVKIVSGRCGEAEFGSDFRQRGLQEHGAVGENECGQSRWGIANGGVDARVGGGAGLNRAVRDLAFGEKIFQFVGAGGPACAHNVDAVERFAAGSVQSSSKSERMD